MTSSRTIRGLAAGAGLALVAGCAAPSGAPAGAREAALDVSPAFARAGQTVQALVESYKGADVTHLLVKVYTLEGTTEKEVVGPDQTTLARDLSGDALSGLIRFRNLHQDTTYRVRGYAYKAAGSAAGDKISEDGKSFFDIKLTNEDRPAVATLSVQLIDKTFNGQGSASVAVHDGVVNNEGPETFGFPAY